MQFRSWLPAAAVLASGLAARAEVLHTVLQNSDDLCTIDTATGVLTPIGWLGTDFRYGDLAWDSSTGTLYMSDGWGLGIGQTSQLWTVDLTTGSATLVGPMNANSIFSLVYDPSTDKLYGGSSTAGTPGFYEIDRATGNATFIGDPGVNLDAMTVRGTTNELLSILAGGSSPLYSVDRATGAVTQLGAGLGFVNNCGMAWAPSSDHLFTIDVSGNLYEYDLATSTRTLAYPGLGSCDGLTFVGASCPPPTAYCTAGTTTNGCVPSIGSSGTPQIGQTSGFVITATSVEGAKAGILFYGIDNSGFSPTPWAVGSTSFLCVKAPAQRMIAQFTGGTTGQCNGSLSIDWLAYMTANPGALGQPLAAGSQFYGQGWFRDPPAPKTTNLTDALRWTICP